MSLAFDDAAHFWEDKLRNPWHSGAEKMQQLTTRRRNKNKRHYFCCLRFRMFTTIFLSTNTFRIGFYKLLLRPHQRERFVLK